MSTDDKDQTDEEKPQPLQRPSLPQLAWVFLRIGATGFGGMMALIAIAHTYLVDKQPALSEDEFAEGMAIGQMLPGPVAVDSMVYMAYAMRGWVGALVCLVSLILPPATLVLILTPLYFAHGGSTILEAVMRGIGAVVVAIVAVAAWRIGKPWLKTWMAIAIAVGSFAVLALTKLSPVIPLLVGGLLGAVLLKPPVPAEEGAGNA